MKKGTDRFLNQVGRAFFKEIATEAGRVNLRIALLIFLILCLCIFSAPIEVVTNFFLKLLHRDTISYISPWVTGAIIAYFFFWNIWCLSVVSRVPLDKTEKVER